MRRYPHLMFNPLSLAPSEESLFALQRLAGKIRYWVESPVPGVRGSPYGQPQLLPCGLATAFRCAFPPSFVALA